MLPWIIPNSACVVLLRAARRSLGPSRRQLERAERAPILGGKRRAFVERHHDVGAELLLYIDCAFRREHQRRAVEMRSKPDALFVDRIDLRQAHRLESARVRQRRARKSHEARDPAHLADQLRARPNREMVRVGEHHRVAHRPQLVGRHRLDGSARSDRHECWSRNRAVRRDNSAGARVAVDRRNAEFDWPAHRINIASP